MPNISYEKFEALVVNSVAYENDPDWVNLVLSKVGPRIFSLKPEQLLLGFAPNGTTTYWSNNMAKEDSKIVNDFFVANVSFCTFEFSFSPVPRLSCSDVSSKLA